jgi:hypothetical protein
MAHAICWADGDVVTGGKLAQPPTIDGVINDDEWKGAATGHGGFDSFGREASEKMQFWLAYDDQYLYFAARGSDSEPTKIQAAEVRSNVSVDSDDYFELSIDVTGNNSEFHSFSFNAKTGNSASIPGGRASKAEWRGEIFSKGRITETGWEGEARIPWAMMRLPKAGKRNMRFNMSRSIPRRSQWYQWQQTNNGRSQNMATWQDVEVPLIAKTKTLKLLPYTYLGAGKEDHGIVNAGLDFKMNLSESMEVAGTINPDFRNIENEILSLDFSYFERVGAESRPFFQEGQEYFRPGRRIYASQRLTDFDTGVKVYGKPTDKTQMGALVVEDFGKKTASVLTYARSLTPKKSYSFGITDLRERGVSNTAIEGNYSHTFGHNNITVMLGASFDKKKSNGNDAVLAYSYFDNGINVWFNYAHRDPSWDPKLGIAYDKDYRGLEAGINGWRNYTKGKLISDNYGISSDYFLHYDGKQYRHSISGWYGLTLRNQLSLNVSADASRFEQFDDNTTSFNVNYPSSDPYRNVSLSYAFGHQSGERLKSHYLTWNSVPIKNLKASLSAQFYDLFEDSTQIIGSLLYDLNKTESISAKTVRYNRDYNFYLSYRKAGGLGAEYFLIIGDPNARTFTPRIILKAVFPLEIRLK